MGHSAEAKQTTHTRIVEVAAKRFRERGLDGIGVADVMKEAGVTVGGFYKHFNSREELVNEAIIRSFRDFDIFTDPANLQKAFATYLSPAHRDDPGSGCAIGAFVGEMGRSQEQTRALFTQQIKKTLDFLTSASPRAPRTKARKHALLMTCALLGAINLSRAVNDPEMSDEILAGVRQELGAELNQPKLRS